MRQLSPAQAEEVLTHLTRQFTPWRQSRTTPRGRIPQPLWAQAVALAQVLPCTRVAKHLGLTPQALKRRRDARGSVLAPSRSSHAPHFVEVTAAWRTPSTEVEIQRSEGTRLRIIYNDAAPILVPLLQTFLESRCCCNSRPRAVSFWPYSPSISAKGSIALRPCAARR